MALLISLDIGRNKYLPTGCEYDPIYPKYGNYSRYLLGTYIYDVQTWIFHETFP